MSQVLLRLTSAERSALECAGIFEEGGDLPMLEAAWDGANLLRWDAADTDDLIAEVNDRSNAEDAVAEGRGQGWQAAGAAAGALYRLMGRIRKAAQRCQPT